MNSNLFSKRMDSNGGGKGIGGGGGGLDVGYHDRKMGILEETSQSVNEVSYIYKNVSIYKDKRKG